jgi:hypothetical protein
VSASNFAISIATRSSEFKIWPTWFNAAKTSGRDWQLAEEEIGSGPTDAMDQNRI